MLSSEPVISTLNENYASSWVLFQDLIKTLKIKVEAKAGMDYIKAVKAAAAKLTETGSDYERLCAKLLAGYQYPVDTHVFGRDGAFLGSVYAGDLMTDPKIFDKFEELLKKGAGR